MQLLAVEEDVTKHFAIEPSLVQLNYLDSVLLADSHLKLNFSSFNLRFIDFYIPIKLSESYTLHR